MIVATAGHIDHGKTTLVRALTGIDTDRLPEEKARGISIDLGFAHLALPEGGTIGFVDVPGHERFVRNMLSGVYAIGHCLLIVAADDGVMPQTREHLQIVDLLGVPGLTGVITKADRADPSRLAEVRAELGALLASHGYGGAPVLAVSAATGDGIAALKAHLADVAAGARSGPADPEVFARYVVDRAFTIAGSGTVVRGTVIAGQIARGDGLVISPAGHPARVRRLQVHGRTVETVAAGQRCAINLGNVELGQVSRGDWIVAPAAHHPTDRLEVRLEVPPGEAGPLKHWTAVHVHLGAADIAGHVALERGKALAPGSGGLAQLRLSRPVQAVHGDLFVLRDQGGRRTVAGGRVLDPFPATRRAGGARSAALDGATPGVALGRLLEAGGAVDLDALARVYNRPAASLRALLPEGAVTLDGPPATAIGRAALAKIQAAAHETMARFHAGEPAATGMDLAHLAAAAAPGLSPALFAALLARSAGAWGLERQGGRVRLTGHDSTANPMDQRLWREMRPVLEEAGSNVPSLREVAAETGLPLLHLRDFAHRKAQGGALVRITAERFALPETLEQALGKAAETAAAAGDGRFTAAEFRDRIGTGRTLAIEFLECLDRLGHTVRQGNHRWMKDSAG